MLATGWIILVGLCCQALFWIPAARTGRTPSRPKALAAIAGGLALAAVAWRDSHAVLLAAQAVALTAYLAAMIKPQPRQ